MIKTFGSFGAAIGALILVFGFQNCAQPGDISRVQGDFYANAMEILPIDSADSDMPGEEHLGADFPPSPTGDIQPTVIATNLPDQQNSNPSEPTPQNPGDGSTPSSPGSSQGEAGDMGTVDSTGSGNGGGNGISTSTGNGDGNVPGTGGSGSDDVTSDGGKSDDGINNLQKVDSCRSTKDSISDFNLNVAAIVTSPSKNDKDLVETLDFSISSTSKHLRFRARKDLSLDKLNIVLSQSGHRLLFKDGSVADLRTPGAQQSGIKVHLSSMVSLEAGKTYTLTLDFSLSDQIVASGNKCLFHPLIRVGTISLFGETF